MKKRVIDLRDGRRSPLLDIVSLGRGHQPLTRSQRELVFRTVRSVPEVMVKVSGGARTLGGVERHMDYIGREGELGVDMDDGQRLTGKGFERAVVHDWELSVEALPRQRGSGRKPTKLVHNLIFSMPPGTDPQKVLKAVRKLASNEWQLKHRYAIALHTDDRHPHVHVVLKAVREQGQRLNIRKATLRDWREQFAENLRELGIAANATERAVRGRGRTRKSDGIFRAAQRWQSTHVQTRQLQAIREVRGEAGAPDVGGDRLRKTRADIREGWRQTASKLRAVGDHALADQIRVFIGGMPPPMTERELLGARLDDARRHERRPDPDRTRDLDRPR